MQKTSPGSARTRAASTDQPSSVSPPQVIGPFIGLDLSKLSPRDRQIIQAASEDFQAVVEGSKPIHAKLDAEAPLPSDGGTTFYQGDGYQLTVLKSLCTLGDFNGTAYGPVLVFDKGFAPGNTNKVSDIRVYSQEALSRLLAG